MECHLSPPFNIYRIFKLSSLCSLVIAPNGRYTSASPVNNYHGRLRSILLEIIHEYFYPRLTHHENVEPRPSDYPCWPNTLYSRRLYLLPTSVWAPSPNYPVQWYPSTNGLHIPTQNSIIKSLTSTVEFGYKGVSKTGFLRCLGCKEFVTIDKQMIACGMSSGCHGSDRSDCSIVSGPVDLQRR